MEVANLKISNIKWINESRTLAKHISHKHRYENIIQDKNGKIINVNVSVKD